MIQFAQKRIAYLNVLKGIEKLFELKGLARRSETSNRTIL
ncbi:hypothetical protein THF1D04_10145 [Vibrio owensii]|uniref:Uncharacterized protein n=1 Tax=Vibrio owensii TaxID=696485 RepID=A0AAU9PX96_9VIBR|nr:hypothetical protein THF1D04_10145 [Vibrio owensii]